ncbi:ATP-binding protein [Kitasatospora camelliae]|uniref:ATP-binding protein n=1 Tax=Kitasatospora camelliae TaxID=3156397 RepID=A0AAU8K1S7_9ACTN
MAVADPPQLALRYGLRLPTVPASVPEARRRVRACLAEHGLGPEHALTDTVLLVTSELVTNSVRHAAAHSPVVVVGLTVGPDELVLAVHDAHPSCPRALDAPHEDGSGGWGLDLVDQLATLAGGSLAAVPDRDAGGKTMVVRLPL